MTSEYVFNLSTNPYAACLVSKEAEPSPHTNNSRHTKRAGTEVPALIAEGLTVDFLNEGIVATRYYVEVIRRELQLKKNLEE